MVVIQMAAGMSLAVENVAMLRENLNKQAETGFDGRNAYTKTFNRCSVIN